MNCYTLKNYKNIIPDSVYLYFDLVDTFPLGESQICVYLSDLELRFEDRLILGIMVKCLYRWETRVK